MRHVPSAGLEPAATALMRVDNYTPEDMPVRWRASVSGAAARKGLTAINQWAGSESGRAT